MKIPSFKYHSGAIPQLKQLIEKTEDLPFLSTAVIEILNIDEHGINAVSEVENLVNLDPVLCAKLLKMVNSAYFYPAQKILNIRQAINFLGLAAVKNILLSTTYIQQLSTVKSCYSTLNLNKFIRHSLCTAIISRDISKDLPKSKNYCSEEFFTAGLLHDLGKIIFNHYFPDIYEKVLLICRQETWPLSLVEKYYFGMNHQQAGYLLMENWNFPSRIIEVLRYHHEPNLCKSNSIFCWVVYLANSISNIIFPGYSGNFLSPNLLPQTTSMLKLSRPKIIELIDNLENMAHCSFELLAEFETENNTNLSKTREGENKL